MNNTVNGMVQRSPCSRNDFIYPKIPDEIARELESQDELYFWSSDGTTLISADGTKTIPDSVTTQKDEAAFKPTDVVAETTNQYSHWEFPPHKPLHKSRDPSINSKKQLPLAAQLSFCPCGRLNSSIFPQMNCFNYQAYVNRGSLGLIMSSVNLILLALVLVLSN